MKTTLIAVLAVSLIAIVSASSFTDGMTTGYIVSNVERNFPTEKRQTIKYNNFTRDTELQKFPPVKHPQCFMEKIKIVKIRSAHLLQDLIPQHLKHLKHMQHLKHFNHLLL